MIDGHKIITKIPWLVLDFEFSGMSKGETVRDEHIIEMCMIKYVGGLPVDSLSTLLNIGNRPVSRLVSRMTGIWPNHLKHKPRFEHIASRALGMFDDEPIVVAHNARRDSMVLHHEFLRLGIDLRLEYLCTYKMASVVFSFDRSQRYLKNYRLGTLAKHCSIPIKKAHRAQDDTEACAKLLAYMLGCIKGQDQDGQSLTVSSLRKLGYISQI